MVFQKFGFNFLFTVVVHFMLDPGPNPVPEPGPDLVLKPNWNELGELE
jgi:hypothetical protein